MAAWDDVETGFDGNETLNFGPRLESGSALYQIDTCAVISADDAQKQGSTAPSVTGYGVDEKLCVAIEEYLSVFSENGQNLIVTICFDSCIESLISSDDKRFLFVAEADGRLHFFHQSSINSLFSMNLKDDQKESTFVKLILRPTSVIGFHELLAVTSSGVIHVISNINLSSLHEAITENDALRLQALRHDLKSSQIDCSAVHSIVTSACPVPKSRHLIVSGVRPMALSLWQLNVNSGLYSISAEIDHVDGFAKCEVSPCGRYLVALDANGQLSTWSARYLVELQNFDISQVLDFRVLESSSCSVMKIVILRRDDAGCVLEVCDFISFEVIYSLRLDAHCYLMPCFSDEKSIFLLENVANSENEVSSLRLRCVSEADFDSRVAHFLRKKKFAQAEEFCDAYNLEKEIVYKMKANHLFEKLSSNSDSIDADILELERCLQQNSNDEQVAESCIEAALPTFDATFRFMKMARQRLIASSHEGSRHKLLANLTMMMRRLATFQSVFGVQKYTSDLWRQFQTMDLLKEVRCRLSSGDFSSAVCIWLAHKSEFSSALSLTDFEDILTNIPQCTSSQELSPWLQDVIPLALSISPESISIIASWVEQKIRAMEIIEKDSWPENALRFGRTVVASVSSAPSSPFISDQVSSNSANVEIKKVFVGVRVLLGQLENLVALRDKYKLILSLEEFSMETTESIVFRLLDRVVACDLLESALTKIVGPYMKEKNLPQDQTLFAYVKDLIERSGKHRVTLGEAPWETKAVAVVHCISSPELQCQGILCITPRANVPWSESLQRLIQKGLDLTHSKSADIQKQCDLMQLQKLLVEYDIHQLRIYNSSMAQTVIYNILSRDRPSAVEDAKQVQRAYNLPESVVYNFRITFLIKANRMSDMMALLRQLPLTPALSYAETVMGRSAVALKRKILPDKRVTHLMTQAAILAAKVLLSREIELYQRKELEIQLADFQRIRSLQVEFNEYLSLSDLASSVFTRELLAKYVEEFHQNEKKSLPKLFRLAELIGFPGDDLVFELAQFSLNRGNFSDALRISRTFLLDNPSEQSARTAYKVAHLATTLLGSLNDVTFDPDLVNQVHMLASEALNFCSPDLLHSCLHLTRLTKLGHFLSLQSSDDSTSSDVTESKNSFNTWTFSPIFEEDGLIMDASITAPLFHEYVCAFLSFEPTENSCESTRNLVRILKENSQMELALHFVLHSLHCHGYKHCMSSTSIDKSENNVDEFSQISEAGIKESFDLATKLLQKVFSKSRIDHHFAFVILSSFPKLTAFSSLKQMISKAGFNYKRIISLTDGAITLATFTSDPKFHLEFKNLKEMASWGLRMKQYDIPFHDVIAKQNLESQLDVLNRLCQVVDVDVGTIQEFCRMFGLGEDENLLKFLEFLLLPRKYEPCPRELWLKSHKFQAQRVVMEMTNKDLLMKRMQTIFNEINMYDYERLTFVLSVLDKHNSSPLTAKGLELLEYLQSYQRVAPPSDFEAHYRVTEEDELMGKSPLANRGAQTRLPMHPFIQGHPWKIISPELNMNTVDSWLLIADVLGLPTDNVYMTTIKNISRNPTGDKFASARSLIMRMNDCKNAVLSASWVAQQLEFGAEKVAALKFTMDIAERWANACGDAQSDQRKMAVKSLLQYKQLHLRLSIEHALHKHGLKEPDLIALASTPEELILALYCHPRILDFDIDPNHSDFHGVAKKIADLAQVDLMSVQFSLIEKWLPSTANQDNLDMTLNLDISLSGGLDGTLRTESDIAEDEENLIRLTYLLHNNNLEKNVLFLLNYAFREKSVSITTGCRIRALQCAFSLVNAETISRISPKSLQELKETLKVFLYLAELEKIQLPHSLASFSSANKEGLVKSIWKNHRHQKPAVRLVANLCLDYKIHDLKLWSSLLQQMHQMQMSHLLHQVLLYLNNVPEVWAIPNFSRYWLQILLEPFKSVEFPLSEAERTACIESYFTLHRSLVLYDIDLASLMAQYVRCDLWPCAMGCAILMPGSKSADILAQRSSAKMLLDFVALNDMQRALPLDFQIKAAIFDDIDAQGAYTEILKAEVFMKDFILHLISSDRISGIVKFAVRYSLLPKAFMLIRLYQCRYPDSEFANESKETSPLGALKIYLKKNNFYEDLKMYLEDENEEDESEKDENEDVGDENDVFEQ